VTELTWTDGLYLAFLTFLVAVPALLILGLAGRQVSVIGRPGIRRERSNHFLFRGDRLIDHDLPDLTLPAADDRAQSDWDRVRAWLAFRFPDLPLRLADVDQGRVTSFQSQNDALTTRLDFAPSDNALRVTLTDLSDPDPAVLNEWLRLCRSSQDQAAALFHAPVATWLCDGAGQLVWQNTAGLAMAPDHKDQIFGTIGLAPGIEDAMVKRLTLGETGGPARTSYEVRLIRTEPGFAVYATDITRLVQAETVQRDILQTLTKTFASLTIGLTVFDRTRSLALFNPALIDMTGLQPEFLIARPGLISFFDALRDRQVMPEPRNYGTWRTQINEMVETARGGLYQEVWSLPTGQTYRVTGRPYPDGDVAFLFEDISIEISATRRHRLQMDLRQSVIDHLEQGIAVLSDDGSLIFCNAAFGALIGIDPDRSLVEMRLHDVIAACRERSFGTGPWGDIEQRIASNALTAPIRYSIALPDNSALALQVLPLGRGQAMLTLSKHQSALLNAAALETG